jgi:hypothetical protein
MLKDGSFKDQEEKILKRDRLTFPFEILMIGPLDITRGRKK